MTLEGQVRMARRDSRGGKCPELAESEKEGERHISATTASDSFDLCASTWQAPHTVGHQGMERIVGA